MQNVLIAVMEICVLDSSRKNNLFWKITLVFYIMKVYNKTRGDDMIKLDYKILTDIIKNVKSKCISCIENNELMKIFTKCLGNIYEFAKTNFSCYELTCWIVSMNNYIDKKKVLNKTNNKAYNKRDILMVDFGIAYGYELGYKHVCVVIEEDKENVLVVPCTSSKVGKKNRFGKPFPEYIEANDTDGFDKKTMIKLNGMKWISKDRVLDKKGEVTKEYFDFLYNKAFGYSFEPIQYKQRYLQDNTIRVQGENCRFKERQEQLERTNKQLQNEINILKYKLYEYINDKKENNTDIG